jgi:hypothetical protein
MDRRDRERSGLRSEDGDLWLGVDNCFLSCVGHWGGIDADDGDAEVAQAVEQSVQLGLVGEAAGQRGLASLPGNLELLERAREGGAEATADDDPVTAWVAAVLHGSQADGCAGGLSSPLPWSTQGGSLGLLLGSEQAKLAAARDGVGAAGHAQLAKDALHMALDGVQGDEELGADLALGKLAREQAEKR